MKKTLKDIIQSFVYSGKNFLNSTHFATLAITFTVAGAVLFFANITPASLPTPPELPELEESVAKQLATAELAEIVETQALNRPSEPLWPESYTHIEGELRSGDTLNDALRRAQINGSDRSRIINALDGLLDFRSLRPRDRFTAVLDDDNAVVEYRYQSGPLNVYLVRRIDDHRFQAEKMSVTLERQTKKISGRIESSLFAAFQIHGEQARLIYSFAEIFASRMDFNVEIRKGDHFQLVFEKYYRDDEFVGYGPILYARYEQSRGEVLEAIRYTPEDGKASYFDPDGRELGASFLRSPVPMARVTSGFNRRRMHPILNEVRPHLAVDLAAPTGTPVMATADGRVVFRSRDGGNGNMVILEHSNGYRSYYAHLSGFKRGMKVGDRVRQRDIIGYVGATGLATGPHVCYRIRHNGEFINPMAMRFTPRSELAGEALARFQAHLGDLVQLADNLGKKEQAVRVSRITVDPDQGLTLL
ncbi:M23 family metallopeptidase [Desulfurivibrio alkaliphilus]|uniref:Peptidase M23 n=1 Tax=Desulfurivibrio alkaliphilus (strain DSM 19089 / UNIQEM U267 / AHT2) TaxID=589865 RepID=D6Z1T8_DESAT|nr:M23 family metallopeptidase [Desulfurivibrio alkaliphilus]ADH85513.1 Peptidase M23 [Desulfurivibrio alkaliphilus AHT 2]